MKKLLYFIVPVILVIGCNNAADADNDADTTQNLEDPALVQPPSENLPDSMRIINDSVIVPDSARDTIRR